MPPSYNLNSVLIAVIVLIAYYMGILIRSLYPSVISLPDGIDKAPLPLGAQLFLGLPVAIGVVGVLGPVIAASVSDGIWAACVSIGIVMEQWMLWHETLTTRLRKILPK